jgi:hypothetical protein
MAWAFITSAQASTRLSPRVFARIFDDDGDGVADTGVVSQFIADASGKVASVLQGVVSDLATVQAAATAGTAHEVVRLTLDVFCYMAWQRHPEASPTHDWVAVLKAINHDLDNLRKSYTTLDTNSAPNPPANTGGVVFPDPNTEDVYSFARDGFGDF